MELAANRLPWLAVILLARGNAEDRRASAATGNAES